MSWIIGDDGTITNTEFIELPEKAMSPPYPHALWRITEGVNDGIPYNMLLPGIDISGPEGAFMNSAALSQVRIPVSVKQIGEWAFTNTALKKVKIAQDCEYYLRGGVLHLGRQLQRRLRSAYRRRR